jgi:hypothetical protein
VSAAHRESKAFRVSAVHEGSKAIGGMRESKESKEK